MVGLSKLVSTEVDDHGVALVRLQRPEALNAFSTALVEALEAALGRLESSVSGGARASHGARAEPLARGARTAGDVRAVVLAGSGRAFGVGAALDELRAATPASRAAYNRRLAAAIDRVEMLPVPTIAAIDGFALGGGLELALACTLRVIAENANVGLPETRLGLVPGAGGSWRLPRLIGRGPGALLMLTGDRIEGRRAGELGIAEIVTPPGRAEPAALDLARRIAANSPAAVTALLDVLAHDEPAAAARTLAAHIDALLGSPDAEEGLAAFLERRPPRFGRART